MNKDQQMLLEAYNEVVNNTITEAQLPSSKFRNKAYSENHTFYRLYVKLIKEANRPFRWAGEFESKEEALEAFKLGHNLGEYKPSDHEYVIKEVKLSYSEKTIDQSPIITLKDKLPELKGIF